MSTIRKLVLAGAAGSVALMSGCATTQTSSQAQGGAMTPEEYEAKVTALNSKEAALAQREAELAAASAGADSLLPPDAKTGECYARVWVEPTYRDYTQEIQVKDESERVTIIPPTYKTETESVLVKAASTKLVEVPAVYGTETETILVKDAERLWRVDLGRNAAPASEALLSAASTHGINLDAATPGMCFHEHYKPATYTTETEQVLVSEASETVTTIPAEYRWVEKTVLVKEASQKMVDVPEVWGTETETVIDKPAHTIWKKGTGPIQKIDEATGEIMCLVEVPATYKTITKRVLTSPATTKLVDIPAEYKTIKVRELGSEAREERTPIPEKYDTVKITKKTAEAGFVWHEVHNTEEPPHTRTGNKICLTETPAQYETVTRRVVTTPATSRTVEIPAEYKTVTVTKLATEAQEQRTKVPAEYKTVQLKELVEEGHMEWRSILCETNMTNTRITEIQQALNDAGYDPGPIDGSIGAQTMIAVNDFQRANNLPVDRYLNVETLKALGVSHQ